MSSQKSFENSSLPETGELNKILCYGIKGKFVSGKGFVENDSEKLIAEFYPILKKVVTVVYDENKINKHYHINVMRVDGSLTETKQIEDMSRINWMRLFGVSDALLTNADRRLLLYELQQQELTRAENEIQYILEPGFYIMNNHPVGVIADTVLLSSQNSLVTDIESKSPYMLRRSKGTDDIFMSAKALISFMPGVSEVLFVAAMLGVIKPALTYCGIRVDFMIGIVGPSGHLKTTLARKYTNWFDDDCQHEVTFSDVMSVQTLADIISLHTGACFLVDDYHAVSQHYAQKKYDNRMDILTRMASSAENTALIFMTAEAITDDSCIFSAQDRIFEIDIPRMSSEELGSYKEQLHKIDSADITTIAIQFYQNLLDDFDNFREKVDNFVRHYSIPDWCNQTTRVGNMLMLLELTEYLFLHYVRHDSVPDCLTDFQKSLHKLGREQVDRLMQKRNREEGYDLFGVLLKLVDGKTEDLDFHVYSTMNESRYTPQSANNALVDEFSLKITSTALSTYLGMVTGVPQHMRIISQKLHDAGILMEDTDKRTKKIGGVRHFVINISALRQRCKGIEYS